MTEKTFGGDDSRARWGIAIALQGLVWILYGVIYYNTLRSYNPFADVVQKQALWAAGSGLVFSSVLGWGYARLNVSRWHPGGEALTVLGGSIGMGVLWSAVNQWGAEWIDPFASPVIAYVALLPGQGSLLSHPAAFPVVLLLWSGGYLGLTYWTERQRQQQQVLQADAEAQRARLQMLRYQLNPHFFFNALNTISALSDESPRRVKEAVRELSGFLRYSLLPDDGAALVTLREEMDAIEHYLAVERMRFEDDLEVTVDTAPVAARCRIPAFLVLPLVENAVKHGQRTSPFPLRVVLTSTVTDGTLTIHVRNTGHLQADAPAPASGTGTGLANVRARLQAQYPDGHAFALTADDSWVHARIDIDTTALPSTDRNADK